MGLKELKESINKNFEKEFTRLLKEMGSPSSEVERLPELLDRKPKPGETYYYYVGPDDEKTRPFCHDILYMDKVFSSADIYTMSTHLNYDVLKYKGSYNCRHAWVRFRGKKISTPPPTNNQINKAISDGIVSKKPHF